MRKKDIVVIELQSPHRVEVRVSGWVNKTLFYFKMLLFFLTMFLNLNMFNIISLMNKVFGLCKHRQKTDEPYCALMGYVQRG